MSVSASDISLLFIADQVRRLNRSFLTPTGPAEVNSIGSAVHPCAKESYASLDSCPDARAHPGDSPVRARQRSHRAATRLLLTPKGIRNGQGPGDRGGMLVPINNRIASLNPVAPTPGWKEDHKKWDSLHGVRILLLTVAFFILTYALIV